VGFEELRELRYGARTILCAHALSAGADTDLDHA
jgi:hypothetical protein